MRMREYVTVGKVKQELIEQIVKLQVLADRQVEFVEIGIVQERARIVGMLASKIRIYYNEDDKSEERLLLLMNLMSEIMT